MYSTIVVFSSPDICPLSKSTFMMRMKSSGKMYKLESNAENSYLSLYPNSWFAATNKSCAFGFKLWAKFTRIVRICSTVIFRRALPIPSASKSKTSGSSSAPNLTINFVNSTKLAGLSIFMIIAFKSSYKKLLNL